MAVGEPGSDRKLRPIDIVIACQREKIGKASIPEFLRPVVKILTDLKDVQIDLLTSSNEDGWTIPITPVANEDGEIDLKLCIEEATDRFRLRKTSIFSLTHNRKEVIVAFIESCPIQARLYPMGDKTPLEFQSLLKTIATDFSNRNLSENKNIALLIIQYFENITDI